MLFKIYLIEREGEKERESERVVHLVVHFSNAYNECLGLGQGCSQEQKI